MNALSAPALDLFTAARAAQRWTGPSPDDVTFIRARLGGFDGPVKTFRGRFAWALAHLLAVGPAGITSLERPAPRLSHYVFRLRQAGVVIETHDEKHGGAFHGTHGRYVLRSEVEVIEVRTVGERT